MKYPAVIFDRDGTLGAIDRRFVEVQDHKDSDWAGFNSAIPFDGVVPAIAGLFQSIRPGVAKIITTGRSADFRPQMAAWCSKYGLRYDALLMRRSRDNRPDHVVKEEIYRIVIEPRFDVVLVVDDRPSVCDMWRSLGLEVLQVTQPTDVPLFPNL